MSTPDLNAATQVVRPLTSPALREIPEGLARLQSRALMVGAAGLLLCGVGLLLDPVRLLQSYLVAWLYWSGLALGALAVVLLQFLSGGAWGMIIRRILEAATRTLPLLTLLFLPLLLGMETLYPWARPDEVAADPILQHKAAYLNVPFFLARNAAYFGIWLVLAWLVNRWSAEQDAAGSDLGRIRRFQVVSAPGLILYVLTMTFASVDWVMSLEPHWFSTIYGPLHMAGHALGGLALGITVLVLLRSKPPLSQVVRADHLHDLGKLLLAFVMVWAYFSFSQYLIIWAGNLPEEIPWYLRRLQGGWQWMGLALLLAHFVLPFFLLLSRGLKRSSPLLGRVAVLVLVMHYVDVYWLTVPAFGEGGPLRPHWLDLAAAAGVGGLWVAWFARHLRMRPLLPLGDPTLVEEMSDDGA